LIEWENFAHCEVAYRNTAAELLGFNAVNLTVATQAHVRFDYGIRFFAQSNSSNLNLIGQN